MFIKKESSLVKLIFSLYSNFHTLKASFKVCFPFLPINKIKFLQLVKFLLINSKTTGKGLNARPITVSDFKFFISKISPSITSVFNLSFLETFLKNTLLRWLFSY